MIRLELGSRRSDLWRRILMAVNLVVVAVAAVGAAIWLDERYALLESWSRPTVAHREVLRDDAAPSTSSEQGVSEPGRLRHIRPRRGEGQSKQGRDQGTSQIPQQSDLCQRAVEQYGRLPASLTSFTSLNSESTGEFTFESLRPARELSDLIDFLHQLQSIPARPTLSYWQEGSSPGERPYAFAFHGVLEDSAAGKPLKSLVSSEVQSLLDGVARRARRSGLGQVTVTESVSLRLTSTTVRLLPDLRATGTYKQISSFAISLREVADQLTLGQLTIVPIREGAARGKMKLSATLEMLVRTSAEASVGDATAAAAL